jgi:hypothetical protein
MTRNIEAGPSALFLFEENTSMRRERTMPRGTYEVGQITQETKTYGAEEGDWVIMQVYHSGIRAPRQNCRTHLPIIYKSEPKARRALAKLPQVFYSGDLSQCLQEMEEDRRSGVYGGPPLAQLAKSSNSAYAQFNRTREAILKQQIQALMQKPEREWMDGDPSNLTEATVELQSLGWLVEHPGEGKVRFQRINVATRTETVRLGYLPE